MRRAAAALGRTATFLWTAATARGAPALSALVFGAAALAGCARTGFPEGGPVDTTPVEVVRTIPEEGATDVPPGVEIEIEYNEPLAPGVQSQTRRLVIFNPDRPEVVTNLGGKKVEIEPRAPLEPNTTYSVTVLAGLPDRRSIATRERFRLLFSTGGPLTLTILRGAVTSGGGPAAGANVRAFNRDRGFGYRAVTDSAGTFEIPSVALGGYAVTAWNEANGEEGFQFTLEPGDSADASFDKLGAGVELAFDLVLADTSAARLVRAEPVARNGLTASFSDSLGPGQDVTAIRAELLRVPPEVAPRGTSLDSIPSESVRGDPVPVESVLYDSTEARELLLTLGAELADSTVYALRVAGVVNAAGLTTPPDSPRLLFRTRAVPDSTLAAPADTAGADTPAAPADTVGADTLGAEPIPEPAAPTPDSVEARTEGVPEAAPGDTAGAPPQPIAPAPPSADSAAAQPGQPTPAPADRAGAPAAPPPDAGAGAVPPIPPPEEGAPIVPDSSAPGTGPTRRPDDGP